MEKTELLKAWRSVWPQRTTSGAPSCTLLVGEHTRRAKQSESQPGPAAHCPVAANTPITWCVLPECGSVSIQRAVQIWICAARTTNQCSVSVQGGLGGALLTAKQALYGDEDRSHIVYSGPFLLQRRREHAQSVSQPWACVCASSTHL
jgi:hypothetical protein